LEPIGPVKKSMPSRCRKRATSWLACSGLPPKSLRMNSAGWPPSLPPSFSIASSKPSRASAPSAENGPERSSAMPTLMSAAWALRAAAPYRASATDSFFICSMGVSSIGLFAATPRRRASAAPRAKAADSTPASPRLAPPVGAAAV
jgi:hypothetical protein